MKKQNSKISRYLRKISKYHLYIFAAGMPALLLLAGTVIINVFWSGTPFPPLADKNDIIKDYMTLYIAMLGVAVTLYGSFVVMYAYGGWKKQHNKAIEAERTMELINQFKLLNKTLFAISIPIGNYIYFSKKDISDYPNKREILQSHLESFKNYFNKIIEEKNNTYSEFCYYVSYKNSLDSLNLLNKYTSIIFDVETIHTEIKNGTYFENCKSEELYLEKKSELIEKFDNTAIKISSDIILPLYQCLDAKL